MECSVVVSDESALKLPKAVGDKDRGSEISGCGEWGEVARDPVSSRRMRMELRLEMRESSVA